MATETPGGYERPLDQVVLVSRLREVQALLGFTRSSAPGASGVPPRHTAALIRPR